MSLVYKAKLQTNIVKETSPLLYDFIDKAINSKIEPDTAYFARFNLPGLSSLAFDFVRYSRAPEFVWSSQYSDSDKDCIANAWLEHAKSNRGDAITLDEIQKIKHPKKLSFGLKKQKPDIKKIHDVIEVYPERSFVDGVFFFNSEYSSNDAFDFDKLIDFMNANRDIEEKLYTAFLNDSAEMPIVKLYVDGDEITLFEGSYRLDFDKSVICYDWNGFFCGKNKDRPVSGAATGNYEYLPPVDLRFRINWLNEVYVRAVKTAYDFYEEKPELYRSINQHVSKREQREIDAKEKQAKIEHEKFIASEKKRIKMLSDDDLLKEHKSSEDRMFSTLILTNNLLHYLLIEEINSRDLKIEHRLIFDPKGDTSLIHKIS